MRWFRFYHEALDDPKVQSLRPELFKVWVNLLCLAAKHGDGGTLPPLDQLGFALRLRRDRLERFMDVLQAHELLMKDESGRLKPHNWDERQYESDDVTKRTRKCKQKTSGEDVRQGNVPEAVPGNVPAPFPGTPPDTDTDYRVQKIPPTPLPGGATTTIPTIPDSPPAGGLMRPPGSPDPAIVAELIAAARSGLGDRCEDEFYHTKIDFWLRSYPLARVQEAIHATIVEAGKIAAGGLARFTKGCLEKPPKKPEPVPAYLTIHREFDPIGPEIPLHVWNAMTPEERARA